MRSVRFIPIISLLLTGAASCTKYLDVKPQGAIIAENIADYDAMLNDINILRPFSIYGAPFYPTDDIRDLSFSPQVQTSVKGNMYYWKSYINFTNERPELWADMYNRIANMNVITEEVMKAKDGSEQQKKQLFAEALVNKAYFYQHLLSFFSPAYSEASAATDFGVPYVTSTDQNDATPARPSLLQSYKQLIDDLEAAVVDLPVISVNNTRPNKNTAWALICRTYMNMQDYVNAEKYAGKVLESESAILLDYNLFKNSGLPQSTSSTEELFVKYDVNSAYRMSDDLTAKYNLGTDLRIKLLTTKDQTGFYKYGGGNNHNPNRGITYAEVFLNKAECLARRGEISGAMQIINEEIRMKRFEPAAYTALTAADQEAAITAVLEERRRELPFKHIRWMDMKRLDKEGRMPEVKRIAADGITVLATLKPGSAAYTFQIPLQVQAFNPAMPLNKQ